MSLISPVQRLGLIWKGLRENPGDVIVGAHNCRIDLNT